MMHIFVSLCQVRKAFQEEGFTFLMKVFNDLNYLENLTGLRAMQLATDLNEVKCSYLMQNK